MSKIPKKLQEESRRGPCRLFYGLLDRIRGRCTRPRLELSFVDAVKIARGCTDYGGGYRGNSEHYEIYQHGIKTVIRALEVAANNGMSDYQTKVLHDIGGGDV